MSKQQTTKKSVSLPQEMAEFGEAKAKLDGRNFSSYVRSLIIKDMRHDAELKVPTKAEEQPA